MKKRQRVLLYGDTLMLAGVRLSLEARPAFEVIALDAEHAAGQDLLALHPDVIIFDTHSIQPELHFDLLHKRNGLRLIGIDPDRNRVTLWSGRQLCQASTQDLVQVIQQKESNSESFERREK